MLIGTSWVSVIKSFMIPRETRIRLNRVVFAGVYCVFRLATTRVYDLDPAASWLLSLLAVLDGAALHLSLNPSSAPREARPLLRVGYITLRRLAAAANLAVAGDPAPTDPIELTREDFDDAVRWLHEAGWQTERLADDAWPHFHGWRVNYEAAAYKLAYHLDLPPAPWSGSRRPGRQATVPPRRPVDRKPGSAELAGRTPAI